MSLHRSTKSLRGRKLDARRVGEIKRRLLLGEKRVDLAGAYEVSYDTISDIDRGRSWSHVQAAGGES